jgi:uracil-DNA glycosylase family 4
MLDDKSAYLKAMDIDVWVERSSTVAVFENTQKTELKSEQPVAESIPKPIAETETTHDIESLDWQALHSVVAECQRCELSKTRTKTVFATGNQTAPLMIIGDAANEEDQQQGEPFSGEAGKLLTAMLKAMGYQRNDVYISNIVKCCTEKNQEPSIEEASSCEPYLLRQIKLLKPQLILVLGSTAAQWLLKSKSTLSRLRGQLHYVDGISAPVLVSYHPAYLLRAPNEKRKAWEDLQMAMKELTKKGADE